MLVVLDLCSTPSPVSGEVVAPPAYTQASFLVLVVQVSSSESRVALGAIVSATRNARRRAGRASSPCSSRFSKSAHPSRFLRVSRGN